MARWGRYGREYRRRAARPTRRDYQREARIGRHVGRDEETLAEEYWPYGREFFRYGAPVPGHGIYPEHHWGGGVVYGLEGAGYAPFGLIHFPAYGYEYAFRRRPRRTHRGRRMREPTGEGAIRRWAWRREEPAGRRGRRRRRRRYGEAYEGRRGYRVKYRPRH